MTPPLPTHPHTAKSVQAHRAGPWKGFSQLQHPPFAPNGLKVPESLIECRVTSRVQSERLELASRKVGAFAPGPGAAQLEGRAPLPATVSRSPQSLRARREAGGGPRGLP